MVWSASYDKLTHGLAYCVNSIIVVLPCFELHFSKVSVSPPNCAMCKTWVVCSLHQSVIWLLYFYFIMKCEQIGHQCRGDSHFPPMTSFAFWALYNL